MTVDRAGRPAAALCKELAWLLAVKFAALVALWAMFFRR